MASGSGAVAAMASSAALACRPDCMRSGTSRVTSVSTKATAATIAAPMNTMCIALVKPSWKGCARVGLSFWMKEESCRAPPASPLAPPLSMANTGALFGSLTTLGSWIAAWNAWVGTTLVNASLIFSPTLLNSMDRKTAVPRVPPMERKNVAEAVATPMSRGGTAFCVARVSVCMHRPSPMPNTAM